MKTAVHPLSSEHKEEDKEEVVFSCSATGKPAPTIKWDFPSCATALAEPQTATVTNSDHTFTTSSKTTLRVPPDCDGHAHCLLNSGARGERQERIPFALHLGNRTTKDEEGMHINHFLNAFYNH